MKRCQKCNEEIPTYIMVDGVRRDLRSRRHCLKCVPFGTLPVVQKRTIKTTLPYGTCAYCGQPLQVKGRKYCSLRCQHEYEYQEYIKRWKSGEISGTVGENWIDVSSTVRRYIFEKFNHKCAQCGWSKINPFTQTLPLEIEHIDGDSTNNKEENLTLLCPNCHSLTKTYRGANKGHGTRDIKWVARAGSTNVNK